MPPTNANKKLGASVAIAAGNPKTKSSPGETGAYGDPWGYLPDANGVSQPIYLDQQTNQVVDTNGLPLTNGGNAATPVSPLAGAGHVPYNDPYLLNNETPNDRTTVQDKALAAKRAGLDPNMELTPAEQRSLGYEVSNVFPGIDYVNGDEKQYAKVAKGNVAPSTAAYPGSGGSPALSTPGAPGGAGGPGGAAAPGSSDYWLNKLSNDAQGNLNENVSYVNQTLGPAQQNANAMQGAAVGGRFQNVGTAANLYGGYVGQNAALLDEQRANAAKYNASDLAALGQYGGALDNANAFNAGNYGQLQSAYGNFSQLAPSASSQWQGDLTSQAASAQADQRAVAAQYQALGQLQNAAAGGLNTQSQAANAYADPDAIRRQQEGLDSLQSVSRGSNDVLMDEGWLDDHQRMAKAWGGVYGGSLDVQRDPELLQRQNEALDQYDQWRNPQLTAQEEFMKELARTQQEQDEGASRQAMLRSNSAKGFGGQMDLAALQASSQQNSTNRMLADLGANANAVSRAERSLQGYGQLSGQMQDQYLQNEQANMGTRMQGLQGLGQENQFWSSFDNARQQDNMDRRTQALGLYVDQAGKLRSQTFDEAYKRGLAGDATAMANADRVLQAAGMSADTAGNIRQQSFNESYSRGMAADNMSQYNRSTSLAASQWADTYRADQQNSAWGRTTDMYTAGRQYSSDYTTNEANRLGATQTTNQTNYGRDQNTTGLGVTLNNNNLQAGNQVLDRSDAAWNSLGNWGQQGFANQLGVTGMGLGARQAGQAGVTGATNTAYAGAVTNDAINQIKNAPNGNQDLISKALAGIKWI